MLRKIWNCIVVFSVYVLAFAIVGVVIVCAIETICHSGALGISKATRIHPIQIQTTHRYPPIIVNVTTPDGQTFEATAEFEDETEQQQ